MIKNTNYIKANTFAFYSINENSFIDFMEGSKAKNVCEFLEKIVEHDPRKRIIFILDNSKPHCAHKTVRKARELKITLVFFPSYSPDLDPV